MGIDGTWMLGMVLGAFQSPRDRGGILRGHPGQRQPSSVGVKMLLPTSGVQTPLTASVATQHISDAEPGGPGVGHGNCSRAGGRCRHRAGRGFASNPTNPPVELILAHG